MKLRLRISSRSASRLLAGFVLALGLATAVVVWQLPVPQLAIDYRDTSIAIRADRTWSLGPGDCLQITWTLQGKRSIRIDGVERRESGQMEFCPAVFAPSPRIELTDHANADYRNYDLAIHYFPDFALNLLGLTALAVFPLIALYYFVSNKPSQRPSLRAALLAVLLLSLAMALLRLSGRALTINGVLSIVRTVIYDPRWQLLGACMAGAMYVSLLVESLWRGYKNRRSLDFVVVGAFLLFIGLLYLPFGFDTMAHWEEWRGIAHLENLYQFHLHAELTGRYWLLLPHALAHVFGSESFYSFNVLYALILWAKLAFVYGILLQFRFHRLYAFLVTMLFAVYPADAGLMYLRALTVQFSILSLLTALYLLLRYMRNPRRLVMAGIWLSLVMSTGAVEAGYALILAIPSLWWYGNRRDRWRNINLTAIWYLFPALKIVYMFLVLVKGERFYLSDRFFGSQEVMVDGLVPGILGDIIQVFQRTFFFGWSESIHDMGENRRLLLTLAMIGVVAFVAWLLHRGSNGVPAFALRQNILMLAGGLLFVLPAVGVLIWIEEYSRDLWRLYQYVPLPAAVVAFSLVLILTSPFAGTSRRSTIITAVCLVLMFPAASRLVSQHEYYVSSANNKRHVLRQILQLAPELSSQTRVLIISTMSPEELWQKRIDEMIESDMIGVALTVLHRGKTPGLAQLCVSVDDCPPIYRWRWRDHLADIIIFLLDSDLSLALLELPSTLIRAYSGVSYDVSGLYNPGAPLPARAFSMLGFSKE